uniref:Uncharacterized protein MANES_15G172400 n=1 Tax=Rhizophora mucronata TaxID=61149 RepID=A0A2P2KL42_RHIMU
MFTGKNQIVKHSVQVPQLGVTIEHIKYKDKGRINQIKKHTCHAFPLVSNYSCNIPKCNSRIIFLDILPFHL